jgi:hypothetical protein
VKKATPPAKKAAKRARKPVDAPKSSYDLAMERLRAADREAGVQETSPSSTQKRAIAEARRIATARLAEREILFGDAMRKTPDPAEREKAEHEYQVDRQRIQDDCERAVESIRRGGEKRR